MEELVETLLPNLPNDLLWVKGIIYLIESIAFFTLLVSPFIMIFNIPRRKKR